MLQVGAGTGPALSRCAGSGGGSTPGARWWRWSARSAISIVWLILKKYGPASLHLTHARAAPVHRRLHDRLLGRDGVHPAAGDRPPDAGRVLPQGAAVRSRLGARSARRRGLPPRKSPPSTDDEHPPGPARLGGRLHGDLVVAVHRRQLSLRPHGLCRRAGRRLPGQRRGPGADDQQALAIARLLALGAGSLLLRVRRRAT